MLEQMATTTDKARVEVSLPIHIMLSVLMSGAHCADPGPPPSRDRGTFYPMDMMRWHEAWERHTERCEKDPEFAEAYKVFKETKQLLLEACNEALFGVYPPKKEDSIIKRIQRLHHEIVEPYLNDKDADPRKIGIIAFYLLQDLIDAGTLIVPETSSFGQALDRMLPALSPWEGSTPQQVEDYDLISQSAREQVPQILQHLNNQGYYL